MGKEILISYSYVLTIDDYLLCYKSLQLRQRYLNYQQIRVYSNNHKNDKQLYDGQ